MGDAMNDHDAFLKQMRLDTARAQVIARSLERLIDAAKAVISENENPIDIPITAKLSRLQLAIEQMKATLIRMHGDFKEINQANENR
jgi:hypothetical protein